MRIAHSKIEEVVSIQSRRDFLKKAVVIGSLWNLDYRRLFASTGSNIEGEPSRFLYRYKTMSVDHFKTMQEDIDQLKRNGQLSNNKTFQGYIRDLNFEKPTKFPNAKSIIILAVFAKYLMVDFFLNGERHEVLIPPLYSDDGLTQDDLINVIQKEIIKNPTCQIDRAEHLHLKLLAARSGLGKYGRNNICYVDGMGSYLALYAFFTDFRFKEDNWGEIEMLDSCRRCKICYGICPTQCITRDRFVIDAGKCITLYNEIEGEFPVWIKPRMHNALIGCMKCQNHCPENMKIVQSSGRLEDITEEETKKILQGTPDDQLLDSLKDKLKNFYPATSKEAFPILTRNLRVLIGST